MTISNSLDPFAVLGVPRDADESEVRARYLELIKQFPPERDPEKFHEIRAAFEAAKDPLTIAVQMLVPPDAEDVPQWSAVLEAQKQRLPRLSTTFLLSLGNRGTDESSAGKPVS